MSQQQEPQRRQTWLVMVRDQEMLNLVQSMRAIWEFDTFEMHEFFETSNWLMTVKSGNLSVQLPDVALIELCADAPAAANQEYVQNARYIDRLARVPMILLCTGDLSEGDKAELTKITGARAVITKPLPGLFELNRIISEACVLVD